MLMNVRLTPLHVVRYVEMQLVVSCAVNCVSGYSIAEDGVTCNREQGTVYCVLVSILNINDYI